MSELSRERVPLFDCLNPIAVAENDKGYMHPVLIGYTRMVKEDDYTALRARVAELERERAIDKACEHEVKRESSKDDLYEHCLFLMKKLAAMTRERDVLSNSREALVGTVKEVRQQLAALQTRCRVLEKGFADQTAIRERHEAGFRETIAQLQATLAAREARIRELEDQLNAKRYFTNEAL